MIEEILLLSGNDIPLRSAKVAVHQPTLKELAYIGEESFFMGCQLLNFSKDILDEEARISLADADDFDILMSIVNDKTALEQLVHGRLVLEFIFPNYSIEFKEDGFHLTNQNESIIIGKESYEEFRVILRVMFGLEKSKGTEYKPKNSAAQKIADKLNKGREKVAALKGESSTKKIALFSRYISILAIGLSMDVNALMNMTVYQLFDMFKRFQLKQAFDINLQARMAGATDLDEVDNWMDDLYP